MKEETLNFIKYITGTIKYTLIFIALVIIIVTTSIITYRLMENEKNTVIFNENELFRFFDYISTDDITLITYFYINGELDLCEKADIIAGILEQKIYKNLDIIIECNADEIIVNLTDDEEKWTDFYLLNDQIIEKTTSVIFKNFLQEQYQFDWIKKIVITYDSDEKKITHERYRNN